VLAATKELAGVSLSILPRFSASAMHVSVLELSRVGLLQVGKKVSPLAFEDPIDEVAFVIASIGPLVASLPVFLTVLEAAFVFRVVGLPSLTTEPMLAVVDPPSLVRIAFKIGEDAVAISLIVAPVTFVHVACRVDESAVPLAHALVPHAFIDGAVSVLDRAEAVPDNFSPAQPRHDNELALVKVSAAINIAEVVQGAQASVVYSGLPLDSKMGWLRSGSSFLSARTLCLRLTLYTRGHCRHHVEVLTSAEHGWLV